ncbi:MAG TPA: GNAT family N-acetyltransferase, partial [archaeon]|nr:GNAT family N-acetyltransferase [archaeon]
YVNPTIERVERRFGDPLVRYLVARLGNRVVGFLDFEIAPDESIRLQGLAVEKELRGRGIGKRLVEHGLREMKALNAKRVELYVREANFAAVGLYKKLGFSITRVLEHEIAGEKAIVMGRGL